MGGFLSRLNLPLFLALRTLRQHLVVALATVTGVAIGMTVVCAILVVDANTRDSARVVEGPATVQKPEDRAVPTGFLALQIQQSSITPELNGVSFERKDAKKNTGFNLVPSQSGKAASSATSGTPSRIRLRGPSPLELQS